MDDNVTHRQDGRIGLRVLREGVRAHTFSVKRASKKAMERAARRNPSDPEDLATRPRTVGDCREQGLGTRENPCPWVSCPYHLYLDVNTETGSIKFNFPDKDVDELPQTCALHVADEGPETLEHTGEFMNITRERVRQIEVKCLGYLRDLPEVRDTGRAYSLDRTRLGGNRH
jgi:hypothetical protein